MDFLEIPNIVRQIEIHERSLEYNKDNEFSNFLKMSSDKFVARTQKSIDRLVAELSKLSVRVIKQIQLYIRLIASTEFSSYMKIPHDAFVKSAEKNIAWLKELLPERMPYVLDRRYYGYKNGDLHNGYINKIASSKPRKNGYVTGKVCGKNILRHRLIYACYHQIILDPKMHVDHINSDTEDNSIWNLQLLTVKEHNYKTHKGKKNKGGVVQSKAVIRFKIDKNGKRYDIKKYKSIQYVCETTNFNRRHIHSVLTGKEKTTGGYYWKYVKTNEDLKFKNEVWKKLCDIDNKFKGIKNEISDFGRVKSYVGIITCGTKQLDGYMYTSVKHVSYKVHTLVCMAFNGKKPSDNHSVDHINKITDDNRKENLRWATAKEQAENNNATPINVYKNGKFVKKYNSQASATQELKLGKNRIRSCIANNTTTKEGYTFEFAK